MHDDLRDFVERVQRYLNGWQGEVHSNHHMIMVLDEYGNLCVSDIGAVLDSHAQGFMNEAELLLVGTNRRLAAIAGMYRVDNSTDYRCTLSAVKTVNDLCVAIGAHRTVVDGQGDWQAATSRFTPQAHRTFVLILSCCMLFDQTPVLQASQGLDPFRPLDKREIQAMQRRERGHEGRFNKAG